MNSSKIDSKSKGEDVGNISRKRLVYHAPKNSYQTITTAAEII